jgi:hypothetical protein
MSHIGLWIAWVFRMSGLLLAALTASPAVLGAIVPYLLVCALVASNYMKLALPCKRVVSLTRSPVFDLFSSTSVGMSTIRAFGRLPAYISRFSEAFDDWTTASYHNHTMGSWMGCSLGIMSQLFSPLVAAAIFSDLGNVSPAST